MVQKFNIYLFYLKCSMKIQKFKIIIYLALIFSKCVKYLQVDYSIIFGFIYCEIVHLNIFQLLLKLKVLID